MIDTVCAFVPALTLLAALGSLLAGDPLAGVNSAALAVLFYMVRDVRRRTIRLENIHLRGDEPRAEGKAAGQ